MAHDKQHMIDVCNSYDLTKDINLNINGITQKHSEIEHTKMYKKLIKISKKI